MDNKHDPLNLFFVDVYNYNDWFKKEKSTDKKEELTDKEKESVDLSDMPPLEGDEEVKEGKY